jgi:hypothetical protein
MRLKQVKILFISNLFVLSTLSAQLGNVNKIILSNFQDSMRTNFRMNNSISLIKKKFFVKAKYFNDGMTIPNSVIQISLEFTIDTSRNLIVKCLPTIIKQEDFGNTKNNYCDYIWAAEEIRHLDFPDSDLDHLVEIYLKSNCPVYLINKVDNKPEIQIFHDLEGTLMRFSLSKNEIIIRSRLNISRVKIYLMESDVEIVANDKLENRLIYLEIENDKKLPK